MSGPGLVHKSRFFRDDQLRQFDLEKGSRQKSNLFGGSVKFGIENRLVVRGQGHATRIWSLDGKQQSTLRHKTQFPRFKLSVYGRYLAIQDKDALQVWDIVTGKEQFRENLKTYDFAFAGIDGETLVAKVDGKLRRILWKPKELIAEACSRFARNMSEDEWIRFFDPQPRQATCKDKALTYSKY